MGNGLISEPVNLLSCVLRSEKEDRDKMKGLVWTQLGCLLSDNSWHFSFILYVSWQKCMYYYHVHMVALTHRVVSLVT